MKRDPARLHEGPFDLLVIGGGIYGSWITYHAARAGLKVALVEKEDWGSGTSSASSKLLHGGLRYLEYYHFGLVRKSLQERRELDRLMPHHVWPLRFLLPVYRGGRVGRLQLKLGLWLYDRLAGTDQPVGPHESFSAEEFREQAPSLRSEGLVGGFSYGDCGTDDARMVIEIIDSAMEAGAVAVNYVRACNLLKELGRVTGATVCDEEGGEVFDVRATMTVNAAGAWASDLPGMGKATELARFTKGVHLVMPALSWQKAVLLTTRSDGRVFFLIPWYGRTLLGTTDTDFFDDPEDADVMPGDIDYLLRAAREYIDESWTVEDMHGAYCGLRTLRNEAGKSASSVTREWSLEEPHPGLLMPLGGKYTSARVEGLQTVEKVMAGIGKGSTVDARAAAPMAWYPGEKFAEWKREATERGVRVGLDAESAAQSADRFGSGVTRIHERIEAVPDLARRMVPDLPFSRAEVVHAAEYEMARTLTDILRRRIPLLILSRLDRLVVEDAATLAGHVLGWDEARKQEEVETVLRAKRAQFPVE